MNTDGEQWWLSRAGGLAHRRDRRGQAVCGNTPQAGLRLPATSSDTRCRSCTGRPVLPPPLREVRIVDVPRTVWPDTTTRDRALHAELVTLVRRYAGHGARDVATALSIDHVDRGDGFCAAVVCGGAGGGNGATKWPCDLANLAVDAAAGEPATGPMPVIPAPRLPLEHRVAS